MAKREAFPSEKLDQYMLRFPDGMRERLKDEAAKNKRSLNAEIIARLENSFSGKPNYAQPDLTVVIDASGIAIDMDAVREVSDKLKEGLGVEHLQIQMQVNAKGLLFADPTGERAARFFDSSGKEHPILEKPKPKP